LSVLHLIFLYLLVLSYYKWIFVTLSQFNAENISTLATAYA